MLLYHSSNRVLPTVIASSEAKDRFRYDHCEVLTPIFCICIRSGRRRLLHQLIILNNEVDSFFLPLEFFPFAPLPIAKYDR